MPTMSRLAPCGSMAAAAWRLATLYEPGRMLPGIPMMRIDMASSLNLGQLERRRREELLPVHRLRGQPLLMRPPHEGLEDAAVGFGIAVAPIVLAQDPPRLRLRRHRPAKRHREMADDAQLLDRDLLGAGEGLEHAHRQPGMALHERAADADQVHDRKDAGALEIRFLDRRVVLEQPAHVWRAPQEAGGDARGHHRVDLAFLEHVRERAVAGDRPEVDAWRQIDRRALAAPRLLDAAAAPRDVRRLDAVVVLEEAADEDIGGLLVFGNAVGAAARVLVRPDAAVAADVDAARAEDARDEGGDADILRPAGADHHRVARQRHLRHVELGEFEGAVKRLLRQERHRIDLAPLDADPAIEQRKGAVVDADRKAQLDLLHRPALKASSPWHGGARSAPAAPPRGSVRSPPGPAPGR